MTLDLAALRAAVLDLDGVLWRGQDVLADGLPFFDFARQHGIRTVLATNNSTKTVAAYVARLRQIGVPVEPEQVITSAAATGDYLCARYPPGTPVYIVGQAGIREALAACGFPEDPAHARVVVVGLDTELTYDKLRIAALLIRRGADFVGTNGDRTFPNPEGEMPGAGALLAAVETATDVAPVVIGKPERAMFEVALHRLGAAPGETVMVGDRLNTDILGAQRAGLKTALVLTGVTTRAELATSPIQPDAVYDSLAALHAAWARALGGAADARRGAGAAGGGA